MIDIFSHIMIHNALICYSHVTPLIWVTFLSLLLFSVPFDLAYYVNKTCLTIRYANPIWFDRYFNHITIHSALICYIQVTPLIWATFLSILLFFVPFDLVYYDIWGLALVPARGGSRYIVNCWLFLYLSLLFMLLIIWNLHLIDLVFVTLNLSLESWVQNLSYANWLYILLCLNLSILNFGYFIKWNIKYVREDELVFLEKYI